MPNCHGFLDVLSDIHHLISMLSGLATYFLSEVLEMIFIIIIIIELFNHSFFGLFANQSHAYIFL